MKKDSKIHDVLKVSILVVLCIFVAAWAGKLANDCYEETGVYHMIIGPFGSDCCLYNAMSDTIPSIGTWYRDSVVTVDSISYVNDSTLWKNSIYNPENHDFILEVAFNLDISSSEVTQEQFNARYLSGD